MELSKCLGCMEQFRGYPCPNCGFDPRKVTGTEYALPLQTILAGKYLVGRVLGQGGFGITYIGWDIALERKVAIKEYYPSGQVSRSPGTRMLTWYTSPNARNARQEGMQMFLKEARKMARLDDIPGVVKVRDLFQENETAYIIMDFVEGQTLKNLLQKSGPMSWEQAKELFRPAIQAMEQVHQAGLIHRDLSPDNLMLTQNGAVKILDLGAAKDLNINSGASSMQVAKGGYSPLEQYTQRGGSGPWTDVYAMAATIYFTLTGTLPPNSVDRLESDALRWDLPGLQTMPAPALEALKKAMEVRSKDRTQSMEELAKGLFQKLFVPASTSVPQPKSEDSSMYESKHKAKSEAVRRKNQLKWLIPTVVAGLLLLFFAGYRIILLFPDGHDTTISAETEALPVSEPDTDTSTESETFPKETSSAPIELAPPTEPTSQATSAPATSEIASEDEPEPPTTASPKDNVAIVKEKTSLHASPSTGSRVSAQVDAGEELEVLRIESIGKVNWAWAKSDTLDVMGWVKTDMLDMSNVSLPFNDNTTPVSSEPTEATAATTQATGDNSVNSGTGTVNATITGSAVNVRSGAGTDYPVVATAQNGETVTILEIASVNGVQWGRTDKGWICMDYVTVTGSIGTSFDGGLLKLKKTDITVYRKGVYLTLELENGISADRVTWSSSDTAVATVYNGNVTSIGNGTCIIRAEYNGQIAECVVRCKF